MNTAEIVLATRNRFKAKEIQAMFQDIGLVIRTLADFPHAPEVEEDGATLLDNARKKAVAAASATGLWALAEDTGLEVSALDGAPGVLSARFAGPDCDYAANNRKLLSLLEGVEGPQREARFRCVAVLAGPKGECIVEEGVLQGFIAETCSGEEGFGYDPLFIVPEPGKTLAEMSFEEKNNLSHRRKAMEKMKSHLSEISM